MLPHLVESLRCRLAALSVNEGVKPVTKSSWCGHSTSPGSSPETGSLSPRRRKYKSEAQASEQLTACSLACESGLYYRTKCRTWRCPAKDWSRNKILNRHPRAGGEPEKKRWIPTSAGMTSGSCFVFKHKQFCV